MTTTGPAPRAGAGPRPLDPGDREWRPGRRPSDAFRCGLAMQLALAGRTDGAREALAELWPTRSERNELEAAARAEADALGLALTGAR